MADNDFVAQMPQHSSAYEHHGTTKDDVPWAVVEAQRDLVPFMPMLNDLHSFTTGSSGAKRKRDSWVMI